MEQTKPKTREWEPLLHNLFNKSADDADYAQQKLNAESVIEMIKTRIIPSELDRYRRMVLIPVIDRLQIMCLKIGIKEITNDDTGAIGELVRSAWFSSPGNLYLRHITITEKNGTYSVCAYPQRFVPVIDAVIKQYFENRQKELHTS